MKTSLTPEIRRAASEMLERSEAHRSISKQLGLTLGQVAALAAHRTMRKNRTIKKDTPSPALDNSEGTSQVESQSAFAVRLGRTPENLLASWFPDTEANPHLLVVGESGSGKTYAISSIVGRLRNHGFSSLIFDFGQGFDAEKLAKHLESPRKATHIDLARSGSALNPLAFSRLEPHGPLTAAQRVADALCRVFPHLGVQQNALVREALISTYRRSGIKDDHPSTWTLAPPSFDDFGEVLKKWSNDKSSASRKTAGSVYAHLSSLFLFRLFRTDGTVLDWTQIVQNQQATVVHLRGLGLELQRTLTEFLLWSLVASLETVGPDELKLFVVLDEAHRIPSSAGAALDFLLREGRKYGVAVVVGSQQPEDFSPVCLTNTATKLVFNVGEQRPSVLRRLFRGVTTHELQELQLSVSRLGRGNGYLITSEGVQQLKVGAV